MTLERKTLFRGRGRGGDDDGDDEIQFVPMPQGRGGRGGMPGGFPGGGGDDDVVIVQLPNGDIVAVPKDALRDDGGEDFPGGGFPGGGRERGRGGFPGGGRERGRGGFPGGGGHPLKSSRPEMKLDKSLKETFNAEVAKAVKDYAKILDGRFLFVNIPEKQVITEHVSSDKTAFRTEEELKEYADYMAGQAYKAGSSAAMADRTGALTMVFTPLPFRLFTAQDQPYEMEAMATFYHELGHLVAPNAIGSPTLAMPENVADVYGILRHIQKYGDESKAIEIGSWSRAWRFVLTGQADHFTTLSIDALPKILEKLDVDAMSPQDVAHFASRVALANTPHQDVLENVRGAFQNVLPTILRKGSLEAGLQELAESTLSSDQAYFTFRIGSSALKRFLDGKVTFDDETQLQLFGKKMSDFTGKIELKGEYWDDVRKRLADRTAQLEKEGILLGMPHKGEPKKAKPAEDKSGWGIGKLWGSKGYDG